MIITATKFEKAKLLELPVFRDFRGEYVETWNTNIYAGLNIPPFVQDSFSTSRKNVLRGFHGDDLTWKLIQVISGEVYEVIADYNRESPTFLQWQAFHIGASNRCQLLIPPGFGNAMLALTDNVVYYYKQTTLYGQARQFTLPWNDRRLNVYWPVSSPILSERDAAAGEIVISS